MNEMKSILVWWLLLNFLQVKTSLLESDFPSQKKDPLGRWKYHSSISSFATNASISWPHLPLSYIQPKYFFVFPVGFDNFAIGDTRLKYEQFSSQDLNDYNENHMRISIALPKVFTTTKWVLLVLLPPPARKSCKREEGVSYRIHYLHK